MASIKCLNAILAEKNVRANCGLLEVVPNNKIIFRAERVCFRRVFAAVIGKARALGLNTSSQKEQRGEFEKRLSES